MAKKRSNTIGAYEARTHFSELLEKAGAGEEITITKHGAPVARLVPVRRKSTLGERRAAVERIQKLAALIVPVQTENDLTGVFKGLDEVRRMARRLKGVSVKDIIEEGRS